MIMACDEDNPTNLSALARSACGSGGGGGNPTSPGGADTQVQFNDAGSFGGDAGLTYNKTTDTLTPQNVIIPTLVSQLLRTTGAGAVAGATIGNNVAFNGTTLSAIPSGADTQLQFNDGGAFGGDTGLTYNKTSDTLSSQNVIIPTLVSQLLRTSGAGAVTGATIGNNVAFDGTTLSAIPSGANTQLQFNNSGAFGADADLSFNAGTNTLSSTNIAATNVNATDVGCASVVASVSITAPSVVPSNMGDTQVGFINGTALSGDAGLTYDAGSQTLSSNVVDVGQNLTVGNGIEVTTGDVRTHANAGIILEDRASPGDFYRVFVTGGAISIEGPI